MARANIELIQHDHGPLSKIITGARIMVASDGFIRPMYFTRVFADVTQSYAVKDVLERDILKCMEYAEGWECRIASIKEELNEAHSRTVPDPQK